MVNYAILIESASNWMFLLGRVFNEPPNTCFFLYYPGNRLAVSCNSQIKNMENLKSVGVSDKFKQCSKLAVARSPRLTKTHIGRAEIFLYRSNWRVEMCDIFCNVLVWIALLFQIASRTLELATWVKHLNSVDHWFKYTIETHLKTKTNNKKTIPAGV